MLDVTTHPHYQAFLRSAAADPGDAIIWLIFADWLEEHGEQERAAVARAMPEFIVCARAIGDGLAAAVTVAADAFRGFADVLSTLPPGVLDEMLAGSAESDPTEDPQP